MADYTIGDVPCDGCVACCLGPQAILLLPEDDPVDYPEAEDGVIPRVDDRCIYLGDDGCAVYDKRPETCRKFDCRETFKWWTQPGFVSVTPGIGFMGMSDEFRLVIEAGQQRTSKDG